MICRVLPHAIMPGPANMALDEALLDSVSDDPAAAVLRTYEWSEPTLSLGYFQRIDEVRTDPVWAGVPLVRRPTGGGAIWHHHELTYALILPRIHPLAQRAPELYAAVHTAIARVLLDHGIPAQLRTTGAASGRASRPFLCFRDCAIDDIVIDNVKIVGSAQRRRPGAVLQHGSLALRRSDRTPGLSGLAELAQNTDPASVWAERLAARIPIALELTARPSEVTKSEWSRTSVIESDVYRNPEWTERR